jgi:hypothetical protein
MQEHGGELAVPGAAAIVPLEWRGVSVCVNQTGQYRLSTTENVIDVRVK